MAPKPKDIHLSLEEILAHLPKKAADPFCFSCSVDTTEQDLRVAGEECTSILNHFQLPLTREIALALITAWQFGFSGGAHRGAEAVAMRGMGVTPVEREHGGH